MKTNACPVTIRGVQYESQTAAARALGVSQHTVWIALENGTLDRVGLGRGLNNARPVLLDGVLYRSGAELRRVLGITMTDFRKHKRAGRVVPANGEQDGG